MTTDKASHGEIVELVKPLKGMGATRFGHSDRSPYTIIEVVTPKLIAVQADFFMRADSNGMSEDQEYTFKPNLNGKVEYLSLRKDGSWRIQGGERRGDRFSVGIREAYHDYSF